MTRSTDATDGRDIVKVKYAGESYNIPGIWIAGFCSRDGRHPLDAIRYWHEQAELEKVWQAQQARATDSGR